MTRRYSPAATMVRIVGKARALGSAGLRSVRLVRLAAVEALVVGVAGAFLGSISGRPR